MSSFDASILASWDLFHLQSRLLQTWFNQRPSKWRLYCGESWALSRLFGGGQSSQILDIHFPSDGFEPETPSLSSVQLHTLKLARLNTGLLSLVFQKSQQATCFKLIPFLLNLNQCKDDKTESWFRLDFFLVTQTQARHKINFQDLGSAQARPFTTSFF